MKIYSTYSATVAQARLKSNGFLLFILVLVRTVFTPYLSLRRWISSLDERIARLISWSEILFATLLSFNVIEALYSVRYPQPIAPSQPSGPSFTPIAKSSPLASRLTRSYPISTPIRNTTSSSSPARGSPSLSRSTATTLGLDSPRPQGAFSDPARSSPAKPGTDDFVMIDRDEREWVDNVWKGIRGRR